MDWKSITSGVVEGLTTALVWAVLIWVWQKVKACRIKNEIRKNLSGKTARFWQAPNLFGINIKNSSSWPVIIRGAGFVLSSGVEVQCGYLGKKVFEYDDHILLKPATNDRWGCPIDMLDDKIMMIWVKYEYDALLGRNETGKIELVGAVADLFEAGRVAINRKPKSS